MEYLVGGNTQMALETGVHTLFIAGAIAMGIVLVSSLVRIYTVYIRRRLKAREDRHG